MRFVISVTSLWLTCWSGMIAYAQQQPGQAASGYGSRQAELCATDCADRYTLEELDSPERVSYWLPKTLKQGNSAPVIVYMHGFFAPVPEIYQHHIDHLTKQGYIVIFPQYHAAGWGLMREMGIFEPADQAEWLAHAIKSTKAAMEQLGDRADRSQIYAYGHSIGGLLLLGWEKAGGPKLSGMVLAHPKLDLKSGIPEIVKKFIQVKELPWKDLADAVTGPVIILGGEDDKIATGQELKDIRPYLKGASSVVMYMASSDVHGLERLRADHLSPMTNAGMFRYVNWLINEFAGQIVLDTYDYRFYFAALDAMLSGQREFEPDMGAWSDGFPFARVERVF